nr:hypothetical protein [Bacteroidota bacterium]
PGGGGGRAGSGGGKHGGDEGVDQHMASLQTLTVPIDVWMKRIKLNAEK